jgi:hypothetical protein
MLRIIPSQASLERLRYWGYAGAPEWASPG